MTVSTQDVSDTWDGDFSGDIKVPDSITENHEKLSNNLKQIRQLSDQTNQLDRILAEKYSNNAINLHDLNDPILQALDLIMLANEETSNCRVFKTPVGHSYEEATKNIGYPTLKFLGDRTIQIDDSSLPILCARTEKVLNALEDYESDVDGSWNISD